MFYPTASCGELPSSKCVEVTQDCKGFEDGIAARLFFSAEEKDLTARVVSGFERFVRDNTHNDILQEAKKVLTEAMSRKVKISNALLKFYEEKAMGRKPKELAGCTFQF